VYAEIGRPSIPPDVRARLGRRDHVADLDVAAGDDDPIDELAPAR
jgi:hypothetical protein